MRATICLPGISHPYKNIPKVGNQDKVLYSDKKCCGEKEGKMLEVANSNKI